MPANCRPPPTSHPHRVRISRISGLPKPFTCLPARTLPITFPIAIHKSPKLKMQLYSGETAARCTISRPSRKFKCTFCRDRLLPQPLGRFAWFRFLLPIRRFKCPHCFTVFSRPPEIFCLLPGLAEALNRQGPDSSDADQPRYGLSDQSQITGLPGLLIRFGRVFAVIERSLWFAVLLVLRVLISPFRTRRYRRSHSNRSSDSSQNQSSGRSRRRRRSSSQDSGS